MTERGLWLKPIFIVIIPLFAGYLLDLLFGCPVWMPQPARLIETFIQKLEPIFLGAFPKSPWGERIAGFIFATIVPMVTAVAAALILMLAYTVHIYLWMALETLICYSLLTARELRDGGLRVFDVLENKEQHGDLSRARLALSRISNDNTGTLNRSEVIKAAVEAVAENTITGVVSPMLYLSVGGGVLGILCKSVNAMSSAVGRKKDTGRYFGAAPDRLAGIFNFIPARLAAVLMLAASGLMGLNESRAWQIFKRDRFNHSNLYNAQTESVCAGALGIKLGGDAFHSGLSVGDALRPTEANDICLASRLMLLTSFFCVIFSGILRIAVVCVIFEALGLNILYLF